MITSDTYRIAAAEQLRIYASILEVPFRVVYSPEEIVQCLRVFAGFDYILWTLRDIRIRMKNRNKIWNRSSTR